MYISGSWLKSSLCNFVCRSESHSILDSKFLGSHLFLSYVPENDHQLTIQTFLKILLIQKGLNATLEKLLPHCASRVFVFVCMGLVRLPSSLLSKK